MIQREVFDNEFLIRNATEKDVLAMEQVQKQCYPTLHQSELLNKEHFLNHIKIFPAGQLIIEREGKIVASASTMRTSIPLKGNTFLGITDDLWITNTHEPSGDWMYGLDMGVLPDFRGLGLSRELYLARQEVCKKLKIKGQIIAGMTIGYGRVSNRMTIEEYCYALEIMKLTDPTVTPQRKAGFRWIRPLYNHVHDVQAGDACVLMYFPVDQDFKLTYSF